MKRFYFCFSVRNKGMKSRSAAMIVWLRIGKELKLKIDSIALIKEYQYNSYISGIH